MDNDDDERKTNRKNRVLLTLNGWNFGYSPMHRVSLLTLNLCVYIECFITRSEDFVILKRK